MNKKRATELSRTFSKEQIQIAKKHMKKCSQSLTIKEMQIKTTLRFNFTPVETAINKTPPTTNVGAGVGRKEPSHTACGNVSQYNHFKK
jgi:hypothetical protein